MSTYLIIANGLGVGAMADYSKYQQVFTNTLASVSEDLLVPSLASMGLFNVFGAGGLDKENVIATYARLAQITNGVGFQYGLREILGNVTDLDKEELNITDDIITRLRNNGFAVAVLGETYGVTDSDYIGRDIDIVYKVRSGEYVHNDLVVISLSELAGGIAEKGGGYRDGWLMTLDKMVEYAIAQMRADDLLILVGNQGVNEQGKLTREYVPLLVYSKLSGEDVDLGTLQGLDTVAMTLADDFGIYPNDRAVLSGRINEQSKSTATINKMRVQINNNTY